MSNRRVFSLPIVIRFDVLKNSGLSPAPCHVPFSVNEFNLQGMEETLRDGVIVTIALMPHATAQAIAADQLLISLRTILAAPIRVNDRGRGKVTAEQRHGEGVAHQLLRHSSVHRPSHDGS